MRYYPQCKTWAFQKFFFSVKKMSRILVFECLKVLVLVLVLSLRKSNVLKKKY